MKVRVNVMVKQSPYSFRDVKVIKSLVFDTQEEAERWARDMVAQLKAEGRTGFCHLFECQGEGYPSEYMIKAITRGTL